MNLSRLIAKAHIPQAAAASLRVGNPAELKAAGLDEPVKGAVTLVSPALDPGSTTIEVWVEARKPNPALKPGMTVPVSMVSKMAKDAIIVPADAVFKTDDGASYVLLAGSDEKAHQKKVEIGIRTKEQTQVVSGINEGDPVITSGGYAVPDGTKIKIEKPGAEDSKESADKGDKGDQKKDAKGDPEDQKDKKDAAKPAAKGKE
jgi:RND family efflux transporter MFP subunit